MLNKIIIGITIILLVSIGVVFSSTKSFAKTEEPIVKLFCIFNNKEINKIKIYNDYLVLEELVFWEDKFKKRVYSLQVMSTIFNNTKESYIVEISIDMNTNNVILKNFCTDEIEEIIYMNCKEY